MGSGTLTGAGRFALSNGGTLGIGSTNGITAFPTTSGNIQNTLSPRNFGTASNYIYNGIAAQVTGNGLPITVNNLTISSGGTVTLNNAVATETVNGTLA